MKPQDYIEGALRTEAPIDGAMLERFRHPGTLTGLIELLQEDVQSGKDLDAFKKLLFYGKRVDRLLVDDTVTLIAPGIVERLQNEQVIRLIHAIIGFRTEMAEMAEQLLSHIVDGDELDLVNLAEEGGDMCWYFAIYISALRVTWESMMRQNNIKLRARYPDRFTQQQAVTRNLVQERRALEGKLSGGFTVDGKEVTITSWDQEHGYVFGTVQGLDHLFTWGWPDGQCLSHSEAKYALDMETIQ